MSKKPDGKTITGVTEYYYETGVSAFSIAETDQAEGQFPTFLTAGDYIRLFLDNDHTAPLVSGFLVDARRGDLPEPSAKTHWLVPEIHPLSLYIVKKYRAGLDQFLHDNKEDLFSHDPAAPSGVIKPAELQKMFLRSLPVIVTRPTQPHVFYHSPDTP